MPQPPTDEDKIVVVSYNVERLSIGSSSPTAQAKMGAVACSIDYNLGLPTILALQEVGTEAAAQELIDRIESLHLARTQSTPSVEYVPAVSWVGGAQKLAFIYDNAQLQLLTVDEWPACSFEELLGDQQTCRFPGIAGVHETFDRHPYVARFEAARSGERLNVIDNHWHAGEDSNDNEVRMHQVDHVCRLAQHLRRTEPDVPVIVLGDLNSDFDSKQVDALLECGLVDLLAGETEAGRRGCAGGAFDHMMAAGLDDAAAVVLPINCGGIGVPYDASTDTCGAAGTLTTASNHNPVRLPIDLDLLTKPDSTPMPSPESTVSTPASPLPSSPPTAQPVVIATVDYSAALAPWFDEHVTIRSLSPVTVPIGAWHLHSAEGDQSFRFPLDASVGPDRMCRVFTHAMPDAGSYSLNLATGVHIWNDSGDAACLYEPSGHLVHCRGYKTHRECSAMCPTPALAIPTDSITPPPVPSVAASPTATGVPEPTSAATATAFARPVPGQPSRFPLVIETIHFDGEVGRSEPDEFVTFANQSGAAVDLAGWELISVQGDQRYTFPSGASIDSQRTCRVYTNEVHEQYCGFSMGRGQAVWRNAGDKAELRDPTGKLIDWFCYGNYEGECD